MYKEYAVTIDIQKNQSNTMLHFNEEDHDSAKITLYFKKNGAILPLSGVQLRLFIEKKDRTIVFQDCTITDAINGVAEVILSSNSLAVPGKAVCELHITEGTQTVVAGRFSYYVSGSLDASDAIESSNEFTALQALIDEVNELLANGIGGGGDGVLLIAKDYISSSTNVTKTYTEDMLGVNISNDGANDLTFTIAGVTRTVKAGGGYEGTFAPFRELTITATTAYQVDVMGAYTASDVVTPEPPADTTAPVVTVSPIGGTFSSAQTVTLSVDETASIFYTLDGSTPTVSSSVYSSALSIPNTATLKYFARDTAGNSSAVQSATYTINVPDTTAPTVTANPSGGTYTSTQNITLSANESSTIFYTVDGSTPTESSTVYSAPISVSVSSTLKYFAKDSAGNTSAVQSQTYTINLPDTTAPNDVTNLTAGSITATGATLNWAASISGDVTSYRIFYNGSEIGVATDPTFTLSSLSASTQYTYTVKARDAAGNVSTGVSVTFTTSATADTTAPTLTASPAAGTYTSTQSVTLSANETATIYYTTDGSTPTTSSSVYSSPITVSATTTLKYFGRDTAGNSSAVQTAVYTINSTPYASSGLQVYYDFTKYTSTPTTFTDDSGNGNVGTPFGYAGTASSGIVSGELISDGTSDYIKIANNAALKTYPFTIEAYVKLKPPANSFSNTTTLFDSQNGTGSGNGLTVKINRADNTNAATSIVVGGSTAQPPNLTYNHSGNIFDDTYRHIAVVFGSNYQKIYMNGTLVASQGPGTSYNSTSLSASTRDIYLFDAGNVANGASTLNGRMKLFRMYNRELTQSEITANYNAATA